MKTALWTIGITITAAFTLAQSILAAPSPAASSGARGAVERAYNLQNQAVQQKNVNAFVNSLTPDFSTKIPSGQTLSREQVRQSMLAMVAASSSLHGETTIQGFALKGGKAYVTTKERDVIVLTNPQTRQTKTLVDDETDAAVWRKVGSDWKEESTRVLSQKEAVHPGAG